jgi:ubiquinol-cytochrome c reductase cytochrome c subunit
MRWLAVIGAALLLVGAASADNGKQLFGQYCAKCHGPDAQGQISRSGRGPSLQGVGALAADFYLRTGYMPLRRNGIQPRRSRLLLGPAQIDALIGYVASLGHGPPVPRPHPERGNVSEGMTLFRSHCAGCHQIVGEGGYVTNAVPPALGDATPTQIAEAVRLGPYVMPKFTTQALSDRQLDSIIRYVRYAQHPDNRGGWALGNIGPVPEGLVSWFIAGTALLATCLLIGRRLRG